MCNRWDQMGKEVNSVVKLLNSATHNTWSPFFHSSAQLKVFLYFVTGFCGENVALTWNKDVWSWIRWKEEAAWSSRSERQEKRSLLLFVISTKAHTHTPSGSLMENVVWFSNYAVTFSFVVMCRLTCHTQHRVIVRDRQAYPFAPGGDDDADNNPGDDNIPASFQLLSHGCSFSFVNLEIAVISLPPNSARLMRSPQDEPDKGSIKPLCDIYANTNASRPASGGRRCHTK